MPKQSLCFSLFLSICFSIPLTATAQTVDIPDPNLRAAIERSLDKASADVITAADMATLIDFDAPNINITDLTGLEHATNLIHLDLGAELVQVLGIVNSNSISDLSPLAGLYQLTSLDLDNNSISDISPLAGLTNLTRLYLSDNSITDISPLAGLYQLTTLWIHSNSITDLSPLGGLTNLTWLDLRSNSITDLSPLAGLYQLTSLWLNSNSITDISPLAGLNRLIHLLLDNNSITDISPLAGLYQLTALRIHSNSITNISPLAGLNRLTYLLLDNNSITDISPLARLYQLTDLALDNNSISDISPLAGLNQLTGLDLRYNSISDISPLVENTGLGSEDYVKLTENPLNALSINNHIPALQSRGVKVQFDDIVAQPADVNGDGTVNILDLVSVASKFGTQGQNLTADVNRDGIVDIRDLVFVAGMFGDAAAGPSAHPQAPETLTAAAVRGWLTDARALEVRGPIMKRGVVILQQLLASLTPTETELLANYPNPFNPETWIPYRLAEDAFVTLTIYDQDGQVVRTLEVGHQSAAVYENRSKAIYWDGRNQVGEQVASGVYFYHLSTGNYSATRKMLILK